jgi:hypothetical protein
MHGRAHRAATALIFLASTILIGPWGSPWGTPWSGVRSAAADAAATPPVVVELFTSQGCSSCPPAEAFLDELADEEGIIALEMHVDYWDYIGWADPFASPQITERQRDYAGQLELRYVYTPQMVIDGRLNAVGSRRQEVRSAIDEAGALGKPLLLDYLEDDGFKIVIPAGPSPAGGATVWLAVFDGLHETEVERGENRGKTLKNRNVVRELQEIAQWTGERLEIPIDLEQAAARGRAGCAILVQQGRTGPILGAAALSLAGH